MPNMRLLPALVQGRACVCATSPRDTIIATAGVAGKACRYAQSFRKLNHSNARCRIAPLLSRALHIRQPTTPGDGERANVEEAEWLVGGTVGRTPQRHSPKRRQEQQPSSHDPAIDDDPNFTGANDKWDDSTGDSSVSPAIATLRRRRALHLAAVNLKAIIDEELTAEVSRDATDGTAAIAPMAPRGWAVLHPAGSSYMIMSRTIPGESRGRHHSTVDLRGNGRSIIEEPRFRSVHDEHFRRVCEKQQQRERERERQAESQGVARCGAAAVPDASRLRVQQSPTLTSTTLSSQQLSMLEAGVPVVRADVHVTLFAPFRVQDLSLHDPTISVSEWSCFDVLVRKTQPPAHESPCVQAALLTGQQSLWDRRTCLFVRLASVDGELRLRSVQFLSAAVATQLESAAAFGHGDALLKAMVQRHLPVARREERLWRWRETRQRRSRLNEGSISSTSARDGLNDAESRFIQSTREHLHRARRGAATYADASDEKADDHVSNGYAVSGNRQGVHVGPVEALLTRDFTLTGDAARAMVYGGPYITELSRELHDALLSYVMVDIGIDSPLREYVCQMQYVLEQEEYMSWLARWRHVADRVQRVVPRT